MKMRHDPTDAHLLKRKRTMIAAALVVSVAAGAAAQVAAAPVTGAKMLHDCCVSRAPVK